MGGQAAASLAVMRSSGVHCGMHSMSCRSFFCSSSISFPRYLPAYDLLESDVAIPMACKGTDQLWPSFEKQHYRSCAFAVEELVSSWVLFEPVQKRWAEHCDQLRHVGYRAVSTSIRVLTIEQELVLVEHPYLFRQYHLCLELRRAYHHTQIPYVRRIASIPVQKHLWTPELVWLDPVRLRYISGHDCSISLRPSEAT